MQGRLCTSRKLRHRIRSAHKARRLDRNHCSGGQCGGRQHREFKLRSGCELDRGRLLRSGNKNRVYTGTGSGKPSDKLLNVGDHRRGAATGCRRDRRDTGQDSGRPHIGHGGSGGNNAGVERKSGGLPQDLPESWFPRPERNAVSKLIREGRDNSELKPFQERTGKSRRPDDRRCSAKNCPASAAVTTLVGIVSAPTPARSSRSPRLINSLAADGGARPTTASATAVLASSDAQPLALVVAGFVAAFRKSWWFGRWATLSRHRQCIGVAHEPGTRL